MRILYLGKHGQQNNDDEGAISHSLTRLGHTVTLFQVEDLAWDRENLNALSNDYDIALFHKLPVDYARYVCDRWRGVCWFFDPIDKGFDWNDQYAHGIKDYLYKGFFTDGDFVKSEDRLNIHLLRQGFDAPESTPRLTVEEQPNECERDLLFIGTVGHGGYKDRELTLRFLIDKYGSVAHTQYSIFKQNLTEICQNTKIMLAMPPVTDNYWSNRAYLLTGRGAFLLHPYSEQLAKQFKNSIGFYHDKADLEDKIEYYLERPRLRWNMQTHAQHLTLSQHLYKHRVRDLMEICNV